MNPYGSRANERIRRGGNIPLNLTSNYTRKPGWGEREGIRELIQNLYIPVHEDEVANYSADNVRENDNGTPREVDWVFESTEGVTMQIYIAYA